MYMKSIAVDTQNIAACGLYCGACRKFLSEKCPGCKQNEKATWCKIRSCCQENKFNTCAKQNEKATWCKIRSCCQENKFNTCAECSHDVKECKLFSNWIGKVFAFLFNSDRPACIRYIKEQGEQVFVEEMTKRKYQTIKRK